MSHSSWAGLEPAQDEHELRISCLCLPNAGAGTQGLRNAEQALYQLRITNYPSDSVYLVTHLVKLHLGIPKTDERRQTGNHGARLYGERNWETFGLVWGGREDLCRCHRSSVNRDENRVEVEGLTLVI